MAQLIASLIVLAFLGIIDSLYLAWKHMKKQLLTCPINEQGCNIVVESKWSKIFFVRNEVLGVIFYLAVLGAAFFFFFNPSNTIKTLLIIGTGIGLLFSIFLVIIQAKVIKDYCFYCMISAFLTLLIFLNVLLL